MIRDIRRRYFEVWGSEEAQNVFLKGILVVLSSLFAIQSIALVTVALRKPVLVAVGSEESRIFSVTPPSEELLKNELKRTVRVYAETHYTWNPATVEKAHADASRYVGQTFVKAFKAANAEQVKIAKEKKVSQKVYFAEIAVDPGKLTARVAMDRVLMVEGLRAVSPLVLEISFEYGPRTATNPEGIYITGEKNVTNQNGS